LYHCFRTLSGFGRLDILWKNRVSLREGLEAYRNRKEVKSAELRDVMDVAKVAPRSIEHIDFHWKTKASM
jgi:hypothetical protein